MKVIVIESRRNKSKIAKDMKSKIEVCPFKTFKMLISLFFAGPQELKVLVDLAIISAGETDMETARITCLHASCLGFAPLIFDLKTSFSFRLLMRICEPVWNAVDADPKLPEKLVIMGTTKIGELDSMERALTNLFLG